MLYYYVLLSNGGKQAVRNTVTQKAAYKEKAHSSQDREHEHLTCCKHHYYRFERKFTGRKTSWNRLESSDKCGIGAKLRRWVKWKGPISGQKKKIKSLVWFRWFAFKFVTNCCLTKNNHPGSVMGKQTSPGVLHSEELVKEAKEGPTPTHTPAEATGRSACPRGGCRGASGTGPWGVAGGAEEKSCRISGQDFSVSALSFFFNVKIPLKILFLESTHY